MYEYEAVIERVIDGDTVVALVDLGFHTHTRVHVRLYGIDTPETRTKDLDEKKHGIASKERLIQLLDRADNHVILLSHGLDKYGRSLGTLFADGINCNQQLLIEDLAVPYLP